MKSVSAPFFEIGPKNWMRKGELQNLASAAAVAASDYDVSTILTVPVALINLVKAAHPRLLVFSQAMNADPLGPSVGPVTAESLVDAGADGVMLNHSSRPMQYEELAKAIIRAGDSGLDTIVCAGALEEAVSIAALRPTVVLFEPPELIGHSSGVSRPWIDGMSRRFKETDPELLVMHAGGIASPDDVIAVMRDGASGTGATSGIIMASDPCAAVREFIAAARYGWDLRNRSTTPTGVFP